MPAFATSVDVAARWRPLSPEESARAGVLLDDIAAMIRARVPDIDVRISADSALADLARAVSCSAVRRAMVGAAAGGDGVRSTSETVGPFAAATTYVNPAGTLYLSDADLSLLSPAPQAAGSGRARWTWLS
ncbi:MAG: Gp19/Gp15/Gp42 family protein [Angustibacter sp.]